MKLILRCVSGKREPYSDLGGAVLCQKIARFCEFQLDEVKTRSAAREDHVYKRRLESEALLSGVSPSDLVWLFDERGKALGRSEDFALSLGRALESGKRQLWFLIGGPYGVDQVVSDRADLRVSLTPLTMNHHVARLVALEQIFRGFTILKGIPYHNASD